MHYALGSYVEIVYTLSLENHTRIVRLILQIEPNVLKNLNLRMVGECLAP